LLSVRSRIDAMSGTSPRYQNIADTAKYVLTANTSQSSGERKLVQTARWFGYGKSQ
jgi:hypothetical protein